MPMLTSNKEALLDLLRTNNAENYLQRRSNNKYVAAMHDLLNKLGFEKELQLDKIENIEYYGEETTYAVRVFAFRNSLPSDGMGVPPVLLHLMIMRSDAIEGLRLLERYVSNGQTDAAFNLDDPNSFGAQQLRILLENLDIFEEDLRYGLSLYAQQKGHSTSFQLTRPLAQSILSDLTPCYGKALNFEQGAIDEPNIPGELSRPDLDIVVSSDFVAVSDGQVQVQFKKHLPIGVSTSGFRSIAQFFNGNDDRLFNLDLSPSAIAVMKAVSLNEGKFDGINTYDRGFLSMGIFQWTLGQDDRMGELPALLKKIKSFFPGTFQSYFSTHGIDVSPDTNTTYGYLTLNGQPAGLPQLKDLFRDPKVAFRFWKAAQHPDVQATQIEHAISRLKNFYWKDSYAAMGYPLNKLITSSYGVALLLDNHVNRPSWVGKCVEQAMISAGLSSDPGFWTDQDELTLINAYLAVRESYTENTTAPMTASRKRAEKMYEGVLQGWLSIQRGTFQISTTDLAIRSSVLQPLAYEAPTAVISTAREVAPPPFYKPADYPDIQMEIND